MLSAFNSYVLYFQMAEAEKEVPADSVATTEEKREESVAKEVGKEEEATVSSSLSVWDYSLFLNGFRLFSLDISITIILSYLQKKSEETPDKTVEANPDLKIDQESAKVEPQDSKEKEEKETPKCMFFGVFPYSVIFMLVFFVKYLCAATEQRFTLQFPIVHLIYY